MDRPSDPDRGPEVAPGGPVPVTTGTWPAVTLAQIAGIWVLSDIGFYVLLPALDLSTSYNTGAMAVGLYYAFWVGIAVITFWPLYADWARQSTWTTFENRLASYAVWSLSFAGFVLFAAYALPLLPPPAAWIRQWDPPELRVATSWYFLPKSVDILFQQLLIVALVVALSTRSNNILRISACCAGGFGAAHALLALGGMPAGYVIRFMVAATAFGFAFPYLILRVPNGLAYSYIVHWLYYALTAAAPRFFAWSPG